MALTDNAIRKAKPGPKPVKLADGGGMHLLIIPAGAKLWRLKYRIDGREKLLAIGAYPEISLGEARRRREEAREMIALGKDPSRGKRRAYRRHGDALRGDLRSQEVCELLHAIDDYEGSGITKLALQIAPHAFVCLGELRHAEWNEIDLDGALWIIPAGKMTMRKPHYIPLSRQTVELFRQVRAVTGPTGCVFPSVRTRARPVSENTINAGLRRLGYATDELTAHGFRAMASTVLNESGK
jgi:integrase